MHIEYLYWKDELREKILYKHGVTQEEVEEVIYKPKSEARKHGSNRYLVFGQTQDGRYLFIVLDEEEKGIFTPVTARDMTMSEKHAYKKRQRGRQ